MKKTITVPQNGTQETLVIVAQEAISVHEQTTSFAGIGNSIVAQEAIDVSEQKTSFPGITGMNSRGCIIPCARFFAVACGEEISCTCREIPSPERTNEIISPSTGATA